MKIGTVIDPVGLLEGLFEIGEAGILDPTTHGKRGLQEVEKR